MSSTALLKKITGSVILSLLLLTALAQQPTDTAALRKKLNIIHADRISFKKIDSLTQFQILAGNVEVQQENTLFYCDSASINTVANILQAYNHVHINDNDSLHIYSDYLQYMGKDKKAFLTGNVRLTDGKGTLTTPRLDYDLGTHIANYSQGGKVVNGKTVLTSTEGVYYEDTRDVYFKKNVVLVDTSYTIKTDTLLYNTYTSVATFIVPTEIVSDSGRRKINTSDGYYDTKNKRAYFGKRPTIVDGSTTLIADQVANDDSTGFGEARGNVIYRDTAQNVTIFANHLNSNKNNGSFLATEKPVMIIKQEDDSIYIAADTLYSAKLSDIKKYRNVPDITNKGLNEKQIAPSTEETEDNSEQEETPVSKDSTRSVKKITDSAVATLPTKTDTIKTVTDTMHVNQNDSTDRFFEAYYHVRIFSDSLQAVGDSLFYSGKDSAFRLFKQPIVWARDSQISGDTIYLYTKNKKPQRMYVFENAMAINKVGSQYYNQVKGRTINGYFKDGNIDSMRTKGNAESIYFAQDDYNKFVGMNKANSDIIDMYFQDKKPERVVLRSNLTGTMYPMRQIKLEDMRLRGFKWLDDLRPKTKYDLFAD